jgi:hypothetical protein
MYNTKVLRLIGIYNFYFYVIFILVGIQRPKTLTGRIV